MSHSGLACIHAYMPLTKAYMSVDFNVNYMLYSDFFWITWEHTKFDLTPHSMIRNQWGSDSQINHFQATTI